MYPDHGPCVAALAAPGFHRGNAQKLRLLFPSCQTLGPKQMSSYRLDTLIPLLEVRLGIGSGFFESLNALDEPDWSFVIKLHALAEAAISHLIAEHLKRPELAVLIARLDMSNKTTGKAAYIEALGLLSKAERRFISSLSELRNDLVHDVKNVNFELDRYVQRMSKEDQGRFARNFNLMSSELTPDVEALLIDDPRQALWYSGMALLGVVYIKASGSAQSPGA